MNFIVFVTLLSIVSVKECAKILVVIPTPSISHQLLFRPLIHQLARRGHQVTVITTDPAFPIGKTPENLTEIDIHDVSYDRWKNDIIKYVKGGKNNHFEILRTAFNITLDIIHQQMQTEDIQNIIHGTEKYDLLLIEAWMTGFLAFRHKFKAPVIQISSYGIFPANRHISGAPTHPTLYPITISLKNYNLTFWEKMEQIYTYYSLNSICDDFRKEQEKVMRKYFGKDMPSIDELMNRVDTCFLNLHPIFEGNFPVPPNVQYMWGIHKNAEKELPKDLKSHLDSSKHGVIYMSFGTNLDPANLASDTIQMFIRVFSQLPYDVLWKWNEDELPGKSNNIKIGKWFPQADLLKHPKIKLFVTQGGLQSTEEAINAGVPLVGLPMSGDQWYNVEKYVRLGIGENLDVESLTEEKFMNTVKTVISNDSYRQNINKLGDLLKDNRLPPLDLTVRWIEYLLRHGGARHLRAPAANISWTQYYEIQLVLTLLIGLIIVLSVVSYFIYVLHAFVTRKVLLLLKSKKN